MCGPRAGLGCLLFSFILLVALGAAPVVAQTEGFYGVQLSPDRSSVYVPYLGNALVNVTLIDVSTVKAHVTPQTPVSGRIVLSVHMTGNDTRGWVASLGAYLVPTNPGKEQTVILNVQAGATIVDPDVGAVIEAEYQSPAGTRHRTNTTIMVLAQPSAFVNLQMLGVPEAFRPDETRPIPLEVRNDNYYPDMITFKVVPPRGWIVAPPSTITMAAGETQVVEFQVKAPQDPFFLLYPTSDVIIVTAASSFDPSASYTLGIPTPISGGFLPGWVIPHVFLLFIGTVAVVRLAAHGRRDRRLERGRPVYPSLTLEQEARLATFHKSDPERAHAMEGTLKSMHRKRVATWKQAYGERRRLEHELAKREHVRHDTLLSGQRVEARRRRREERGARRGLKREERRRGRAVRKLEKRRRTAYEDSEKVRRQEERRVAKENTSRERQAEDRLEELLREREKEAARQAKLVDKERADREKELERLRDHKAKLERKARKERGG